MHTTADARVFLAKPFGWWVDHGWGQRAETYGEVSASDAVQLANAGVTCQMAGRLEAAGYTTLEEKLAARPPRLPVAPGRFALFVGSPASSAVTDDPRQAQKFVNATPAVWDRWQHTQGVECVHVHPSLYWQAWSDGRCSRGLWLPESRPTLPPTPADVLAVVIGVQNSGDISPAMRQQLFSATEHERLTVEVLENYAPELLAEVALIRHTVTMPGSTVVFWRVIAADGGRINHGATTQSALIYLGEDAARADYAEQCGKRGLG